MGEQTARVTNFPHFPFEHHFLDGFGFHFFVLRKRVDAHACWFNFYLLDGPCSYGAEFAEAGDGVWGCERFWKHPHPQKNLEWVEVEGWCLFNWWYLVISIYISVGFLCQKWLLQFLGKNGDFCTPKIYCYLYSPFWRGGEDSILQMTIFVCDFSLGHQTIHC